MPINPVTNEDQLSDILFGIDWLIYPITQAGEDPAYRDQLFLELGWDFSIIPNFPLTQLNTALANCSNALGAVLDYYNHFPKSFPEVILLINDLRSLFTSLNSLPDVVNSSSVSAAVKTEFGTLKTELFDFLLYRHLTMKRRRMGAILEILGVLTSQEVAAKYSGSTLIRKAYTKRAFNYDNIGKLLSNGFNQLKPLFFQGGNTTLSTVTEAQYLADQLFPIIARFFRALNFRADYGIDQAYLNMFTTAQAESGKKTLLLQKDFDSLSFGVFINPASTAEGGLGYLIIPFGTFNLSLDLGKWALKGSLNEVPAIIQYKNGKILLPSSFSNQKMDFSIGLQSTLAEDGDECIFNFEIANSISLAVKNIGVSFTVNATKGQDTEYKAGINVQQMELSIKRGDTDSFINKVIPEDGLSFLFDFEFGYSNKNGFYLSGGAGFEVTIPLHIKIPGLSVNELKLSIKLVDGNIAIGASTSFDLNLGPISATVRDIGIRSKSSSNTQGTGSVGKLDSGVAFKPPTGVGLSINASAVKGGGFLNYDEATWTYTGGLELSFSKISFSAIGIVSTKLPGGKPGYSLLIIISAEFTPIQLGMGFTLNGIGGILGLNRTMNPDVLRNGIRDNTLDSILFPKDIVKNANTIISNIGQAFPAKEGQFLIGPMAKIGWGTPTLLTIELGIIIELPEPVRLAILGVVKALLPSKDNAIVKIQVNFLGIIDFTNKYLSFDASLYDSKILTFGLFGDMALRLYWGNKPNFLLSVGGFHPKFTPPPMNLPELRRLTIVLANQDNLKISVETYFAITSNSVQFGAKVAAMAKAWKIQAIGALWFDILFQFKPFYFIADMGVMFAIKMGSKTILSLYVNLTLEGPNPWRARGKGSFKVLFVKVSVSFDKTFGQARVEAIQAEAIDGRVKAALTNRDNWEALLPARSHELISWREEDISNPATEISVDPAGSLKINQRLIPLQTTMSKFGSSAISDYKRYDITSVKAGTDTLPKQTIQDNFARNEFFYMTDDEKLSRSSYELFDSGVIVGSDKIDSQYAVHSACHYEEITLDAGYRRPEPIYALSANLFGLHRFGNYISRSGLSDFDRITTSVGPNRVKVDLQKEEFVLIDRNNMNEVSGYFSNSAAAQQYLTAQQAGSPATAGNWIVANRFEL